MVSTCGESLPPPWLSSFQTVDPLAHLFATCLLPSPNPAVWCHPRPPLQPRPSPLAILTPATARVGAPWLLLRAETRIEGSGRIGRLSYLHTRIHIYIYTVSSVALLDTDGRGCGRGLSPVPALVPRSWGGRSPYGRERTGPARYLCPTQVTNTHGHRG